MKGEWILSSKNAIDQFADTFVITLRAMLMVATPSELLSQNQDILGDLIEILEYLLCSITKLMLTFESAIRSI